MVTVRNKSDTLQMLESHAPNGENDNFVAIHIHGAECLPTKPIAKCRVL